MTVLLVIMTIVAINAIVVAVFFYMKSRKVNEPVSNNEPTTEPEPVEKPSEEQCNFKVGDWIVCNSNNSDVSRVTEITYDTCVNVSINGIEWRNSFSSINWNFHLWDTTKDAQDGDVLVGIDEDFATAPWIGIFKCLNKNYPDRMFDSHCFLQAGTHTFISPETESIYENICVGHSSSFTAPATKEQRDLLFAKMAEAGYQWDAETKTLSKIEEPAPEPEPEPTPEPVGTEDIIQQKFDDVIAYFSNIIPIGEKTRDYLWGFKSIQAIEECFPFIYDYCGNTVNKYVADQYLGWIVGLALSELVPEKRQQLIQMAYDYKVKGTEQPTYGWTMDSDPNIARMVAAANYAMNRNPELIQELRKEVGGKMLTYKNDISECYIDCTKFMPTAPFPFLEGYTYRPKGLPVDATPTADMDEEIHNYISQYYSLDTKDKEKRQRTIQAIADKEYKKPHLFGKSRIVKDDKYGGMTFNPIFGTHNIGVEIPDNGVIAEMCYTLGKPCSHTRESLLNQEYGRRRPGEGETDGKANSDPKQRVLVNYAIEEGDGRSTGYYNKNGQYVDNNGMSIGDYETYFQNQVYANSYPSGHSAYIMGVGLILTMIMPERADKILRAVNEYANSRMICRFHWQSDTIHGRIIGTMMVPVLAATTNVDFDSLLKKAKEEYQRILSGDVTPEPTPTEKVNTSLAYSIGGYGSCHVDTGEKEMVHRCTKQCTKERHPSITVNQRVEFTLEGGITTDDGKTSGTWEANGVYGIKCPAVKEDVIATITMRNENGVKVLEYRCSKDGTHDDGPKEI